MALQHIQHLDVYYEFEYVPGKPVLVLSNSLGTSLAMWAPQKTIFAKHFSLLTYDTRGHGGSSVPEGPYTIAQMGQDLVELLDALNLDRVNFCGLSMGGMVGQWIAVHAPQRLARLVLSNTAAKIGTIDGWNERIHATEVGGMQGIARAVMDRWFTADFQQQAPAAIDATIAMLLRMSPAGYAASCAAVRDMDQRNDLSRIAAPVLVVYGTEDEVTPPELAYALVRTISGAEALALPCAHLANVEAHEQFTAGVLEFLLADKP